MAPPPAPRSYTADDRAIPDFDVFDAANTWDPATTKVVTDRMAIGGFSFFSAHEQPTLRALCDVAVAQDQEPRIPVPELVDEKLAAGRLDGYQYADMPDDRETWQITLARLDEVASARHNSRFADLELANQESIIEAFSKGWLTSESFDQLNVSRA